MVSILPITANKNDIRVFCTISKEYLKAQEISQITAQYLYGIFLMLPAMVSAYRNTLIPSRSLSQANF